MQKGFILIVLLIILVVTLSIGGYFWFKTSTKTDSIFIDRYGMPIISWPSSGEQSERPTPATNTLDEVGDSDLIRTDWKIYEDAEWGFSIQYPKDWFFFPRNTAGIGNSIAISNIDITKMQSKGDELTRLRINIYRDKTDQTSVEDYLKLINQGRILSTKHIVIGGISGIEQEVEGLGKYITVRVIKDGHVYLLAAVPSESKYINTFNQILSTFNFLDKEESIEGRFCGGIAANLPENQCPKGYKCRLDGNYPDASGKCVKSIF